MMILISLETEVCMNQVDAIISMVRYNRLADWAWIAQILLLVIVAISLGKHG